MRSTRGNRADVSNFYDAVYHLVAQIPQGKVTTYGQIARWLGHPSAARAVGYALHALPTGSDIPWQRVINAAGRVSSRCDQHDEAIQRTLLEAEGVRFDSYGSVDLQRFGWRGPLVGGHEQRREAHQHQETHQQEEDRHIPAQGSHIQASRHRRAQLSAQDNTRPSEHQKLPADMPLDIARMAIAQPTGKRYQ